MYKKIKKNLQEAEKHIQTIQKILTKTTMNEMFIEILNKFGDNRNNKKFIEFIKKHSFYKKSPRIPLVLTSG